MRTIEDYRKILKEYWGHDDFRGIQREIIESIGSGKDTLGLMPTGGGKSVCFQVPTIAMDGMCIVVTPLIALMKDQVSQLRMREIKAEAVYSGMMRNDIERVLENCVFGNFKFLYVSPERLTTELFQAKLCLPRKVFGLPFCGFYFSLPQLLQLLSSVLHCLLLPSFSSHY